MKKLIYITFMAILAGCYRTEYQNVRPGLPEGANFRPEILADASSGGWQHFFLWGLVPEQRVIDAKAACGSPESIAALKTRRTFLEGLVASVAGFYVNIYSPWDGSVYCKKLTS